MSWFMGGCAARGPAAITHQTQLISFLSINFICCLLGLLPPSLINWIPFATPLIPSINQRNENPWIDLLFSLVFSLGSLPCGSARHNRSASRQEKANQSIPLMPHPPQQSKTNQLSHSEERVEFVVLLLMACGPSIKLICFCFVNSFLSFPQQKPN